MPSMQACAAAAFWLSMTTMPSPLISQPIVPPCPLKIPTPRRRSSNEVTSSPWSAHAGMGRSAAASAVRAEVPRNVRRSMCMIRLSPHVFRMHARGLDGTVHPQLGPLPHAAARRASVDDGLVDQLPHPDLVVDVAGRDQLRQVDDDEILLGVDPVGRVVGAVPAVLAGGGR